MRGILLAASSLSDLGGLQVLGACSVVGPVVEVELLRETVPDIPDPDFLDAIDELLARQILFERTDSSMLEFTHDLLRELTYEGLSLSRRRAMHRRVAETLERRSRKSTTPNQLAAHYSEARVVDKAFQFLLLAASSDLALHTSAHY